MNKYESKEKLLKQQDFEIKELRKQNLCLSADLKAAEDRFHQLKYESSSMEGLYSKYMAEYSDNNKQVHNVLNSGYLKERLDKENTDWEKYRSEN